MPMPRSQNRRAGGRKARSREPASAARPSAASKGGGFSLASFVGGLAVGAIATVAALVALQLEGAATPSPDAPPVATVTPAPVSFEFWERLPSERVGPVPPPPPAPSAGGVAASAPATDAPAQSPTPAPAAPTRTEYLLQVGAFREAGAAEQRRAELILSGMQAQTKSIGVEDGVLYRVIVGPFPTMAETRRVMGELQARQIAPILLERAARRG